MQTIFKFLSVLADLLHRLIAWHDKREADKAALRATDIRNNPGDEWLRKFGDAGQPSPADNQTAPDKPDGDV